MSYKSNTTANTTQSTVLSKKKELLKKTIKKAAPSDFAKKIVPTPLPKIAPNFLKLKEKMPQLKSPPLNNTIPLKKKKLKTMLA